MTSLKQGVKKILKQNGVTFKTFVVPGAVEIAFMIKRYAELSLTKADAFIALGTVIRGDTPHFDYVCQTITNGVGQLNLILDVPTIFGILTVDNEQQAIERIGGKHGHKGEEAAFTAIKMIAINKQF